MRKIYSSPVVADYGSIADCTFATPALGGDPQGNITTCPDDGSAYVGEGSKNYLVLACDKFGEYSHS
jgi:hypothetical protein